MKTALLFLALLLAVAVNSELVLLSNRDYIPDEWQIGERAAENEPMTFRVFLKQRNLDRLEQVLLDVSDPDSPQYGKHWSIEKILDLIAPADKDHDTVTDWLISSGVSNFEDFRDSLKVYTTSGKIESLFNTRLYYYYRGARKLVRQFGAAYIPDEIAARVDMFTGIDDFLAPKRKLKTRPIDLDVQQEGAGYVVVDTIRRVYNLPATVATNPKSSVCLAEFQDDQSFNPTDLTYFQQQNAVDLTPVSVIVGPYQPASPDAESTLDVQYATAIADNTTVWFWTTTGWMLDFAQDFFNNATVPYIVSMSWGWTENQQCQVINCNGITSQQYVNRTNAEWVKIGARGVSLFAASGDQGAPGDGDTYCNDYSDPLTPIWPGASPYITSVGATMLTTESSSVLSGNQRRQSNPPICQTYQCATTNNEAVCTYPTALITTGGGFSYYSPRPLWQSAAVSKYLASGVALPPAGDYNATDRGFPDVSGLGHNYVIRLGGQWEVVDGTSCSSPVWAAITALLNDYRFNAGKAPLGFLAPLLYKLAATNPSAFHDQTTGNNKCTESCCSNYGYLAAPGWDPVTGLGTPDYTALLAYIQTLP